MKIQEAKTIKEWLEELPEPYRTQALKNTKKLDYVTGSLERALNCAFDWDSSKEGYNYWGRIFLKIKRNEPLQS